MANRSKRVPNAVRLGTLAATTCVIVAFESAGHVAQASFDCEKARTLDQKAICGSVELSAMDILTTKAFSGAGAVDRSKTLPAARSFGSTVVWPGGPGPLSEDDGAQIAQAGNTGGSAGQVAPVEVVNSAIAAMKFAVINCGNAGGLHMVINNGPPESERIDVMLENVTINLDENIYLNAVYAIQFLDLIKKMTYDECTSDNPGPRTDVNKRSRTLPSSIFVRLWEVDRGAMFGYQLQGGDWNVDLSRGAQLVAERHIREEAKRLEQEARMSAALNEAAKKEAERQAQQRNQATFIAQYGVRQFAQGKQVLDNPFLFKDTVVGIYTRSSRMVEEDVAIFDNILIVSGVPATAYPGNQTAVLAVRVRGTKEYRGNMVPDLEYVGGYVCTHFDCSDFFAR